MLIAFLSAKGSPGVTASVLALASQWPRSAIAVDLDPQGGDVLPATGGGRHPARHGIVEVVVDARTTGWLTALGRHVIRPVPHGPSVLAGFGAAGQAGSVPWPQLAGQLAALPGADVLADCGRFCLDHPVAEILRQSDLVVLVTGTSLRAARAAARTLPLISRAAALVGRGGAVVLLAVRPDMPYSAREVAAACQTELIGVLPDDPAAARVWTDAMQPGRRFSRSPLQRAAADLAVTLLERCGGRAENPTARLAAGLNGAPVR